MKTNRITFPEGSRMSPKAGLECELNIERITFEGEITAFHYEEEEENKRLVHYVEFGEPCSITIHSDHGRIQFWEAQGVDFDFRMGELIIRPQK